MSHILTWADAPPPQYSSSRCRPSTSSASRSSRSTRPTGTEEQRRKIRFLPHAMASLCMHVCVCVSLSLSPSLYYIHIQIHIYMYIYFFIHTCICTFVYLLVDIIMEVSLRRNFRPAKSWTSGISFLGSLAFEGPQVRRETIIATWRLEYLLQLVRDVLPGLALAEAEVARRHHQRSSSQKGLVCRRLHCEAADFIAIVYCLCLLRQVFACKGISCRQRNMMSRSTCACSPPKTCHHTDHTIAFKEVSITAEQLHPHGSWLLFTAGLAAPHPQPNLRNGSPILYHGCMPHAVAQQWRMPGVASER